MSQRNMKTKIDNSFTFRKYYCAFNYLIKFVAFFLRCICLMLDIVSKEKNGFKTEDTN